MALFRGSSQIDRLARFNMSDNPVKSSPKAAVRAIFAETK